MGKKSVFVVLAAGCLLAPRAFAAERGDGPVPEAELPKQELRAISGDFIEMMYDRLDLDDKQRRKVKAVVDEANSKTGKKLRQMRKLREQLETLEKGINAAKREAFENIRSELNYEQRERFDELRLHHRGHQRHRRRRIRMKRRGDDGEMEEMEMFLDEDDPRRLPRGWRFMPPPEMWEGDEAPGRYRRHERERMELMERRRHHRRERDDDDWEPGESEEMEIEMEDDGD